MDSNNSSRSPPGENPSSNALVVDVAIARKWQEIKAQLEEIIREEENNLKIDDTLNRMMEQLNVAPAPTIPSPRDDFEVEVSARAKLSPIKRRMMEKITNLLTANAGTNHSSFNNSSTSSNGQGIGAETRKNLSGVEKTTKDASSSQTYKEWVPQDTETENNLTKELASTDDAISTPHVSTEDSTAFGTQEVENLEGLGEYKLMTIFLPAKFKKSMVTVFPSIESDQSREGRTWSIAVTNTIPCPELIPICSMQINGSERVNNEDSVAEGLEEGDSPPRIQLFNYPTSQSSEDLCIRVSDYYVKPSGSDYFKIDWEEQYTHPESRRFLCKLCEVERTSATQIIDHIWATHSHGRFMCPLCPNGPGLFSTTKRHDVGRHIKDVHETPSSGIYEDQALGGS